MILFFPRLQFFLLFFLTASDFTMYPFSTQNAKDFENLLSVYLDAAFFPHLREQDFRLVYVNNNSTLACVKVCHLVVVFIFNHKIESPLILDHNYTVHEFLPDFNIQYICGEYHLLLALNVLSLTAHTTINLKQPKKNYKLGQ